MRTVWMLALASALLVACGGPGSDAGTDANAPPPDSGADGGGIDAGPDAGPDAGTDSGPTDSGPGDSGPIDASFATPTPMTLWNWRPVVETTAAMKPPAPYLVDTGAPIIVLDSDYVAAPNGVYTVDITAFGTFWMAQDAILFNLFGSTPAGHQVVAGIIGATFLLPRVITFDYQNLGAYLFPMLTGLPPVNANVGATDTIAFTITGGGSIGVPMDGFTTVPPSRIMVNGTIEGVPVVIFLDTGTRHTIVDEGLFAALGDPSRPILDGVNVNSSAGIVPAQVSRVSNLTIGTSSIDGESVIVIPGTSRFANLQAETGVNVEVMLGGTWLRHFLYTVDYPDNELLLARYAADSHIPANEWIGPGFEVNAPLGGGFIIHDVYTGTDAEVAGVPEGGELLSIDGTALTGMSLDQVRTLLRSVPVGNSVDVEVDDGMGPPSIYPVLVEDLLPAYP